MAPMARARPTTGPLWQGISTAVGMALAERMANARFGDDLVDDWTYDLAGDGCLMEGILHEAIDLAGYLGLGRLLVFWDDNRITIDGATDLSTSMNEGARFAAAGWHVQAVDGHDNDAIAAAIVAARGDARPSMIACRTMIGKDAPYLGGSHKVHGAPLGADQIAATRAAADGPKRGVLGYTDRPNVSANFNHDAHSSIFHMDQTKVMGGRMVRILS